MKHLTCFLATLATLSTLVGCIEPDLNLPAESYNRLHVDLVTDTTYRTRGAAYPKPTSYEFRHFVTNGDSNDEKLVESTTLYRPYVDRDATVGRHRFLAWSNIDSPDGTQVVTISEQDGHAIASTTPDPDGITMRDTTAGDSLGMPTIRHAPEMFYGGQTDSIVITQQMPTYSGSDASDSMSTTNVRVRLRPLVYRCRLEIILTGNDGHITGTPGQTVLTSMARSVDIGTGRTSHEPCGVFFTSTMAPHKTSDKESNDTIRGTLTTFGLCDMDSYHHTGESIFNGGRSDLRNYLFFTLTFSNGASKTYRTDVTDVVKTGNIDGVIKIDIDASSIPMPDNPNHGSGGGATFNPTVDDYDDVVHEFDM